MAIDLRRTRLAGVVSLSHRMVFAAVATAAAAAYVLLVALGVYLLALPGGELGRVAPLVLLAVALLLPWPALASENVRRRFRVFVQKHFLAYRYDYRHEWLRFTHALSRAAGEDGILETSIRAIADIVDSPGGRMWILDDSRSVYQPAAAAPGRLGDEAAVAADDPLVAFLAQRGWIVGLPEFRAEPKRYGSLEVPSWLLETRDAWLVIPLLLGPALIGFVVLDRPALDRDLNFEDHDLLKTVGRDVATHISQFETSRRLAENRQFSAYHQLSAFVIHDLKNLIAQLSLVVRNAEKHRHNPEFVDDSIATIMHSVDRMTRLIGQLKSGPLAGSPSRVPLDTLLEGVVARCRDEPPEPRLVAQGSHADVVADPERLSSALEHLVRNAQDATTAAGSVVVTLTSDAAWSRVAITDDGVGMDTEFVRRCLFSPFNTTKGEAGMGIGAYQAREYVRSLGGDIQVSSEPRRGTTLEIRLPIARGSEPPADPAAAASCSSISARR